MAEKKMTAMEAESLLSPAEVEELRAQAREEILAQKKALAKKAMLAEFKAEVRREEGMELDDARLNEKVFVVLDLAEYANHVWLDGRPFFHNQDYFVTRAQADYLLWQAQETHRHQAEVDGRDPNLAMRKNRSGVIQRNAGTTVGGKRGQVVANAPARTN